MLLRAAARSKVITHAELRRIYAPITEFRQTGKAPSDPEWITRELLPHGKRLYLPGDPAGPQPQRGDVVLWGRGDHVVMATGRTSWGSPEVYSFWPYPKDVWPYPKDDFMRDPDTGSSGMVTDAVQITNIDELAAYIDNGEKIWFGRGPW